MFEEFADLSAPADGSTAARPGPAGRGWGLRALLLLAGAGLVSLGVAGDAAPVSPIELVRRALSADDFLRAERLLADELRQKPGQPELLELQADVWSRQGKCQAALEQIQNLRQRFPANGMYRLREAQFLSRAGRLQSAGEAYRSLVRDFPKDEDARAGYGLTLYWRGNWREAEDVFNEVMRVEPRNEVAFHTQLRVLMATGRASEAYRRASERDQQNSEQDAELGLIRATLAGRVGAVALAERWASRPTGDPDLQRRQLVFRARQLMRHGEPARGVALLRACAEARPQVYDARVNLADACAATGNTAEARANYERAIRLSAERVEAHLGLARLASREERLRGSRRIYRQIVVENTEAFEGWLGLLRVAQLLGDTETAGQAIGSLDRIAPQSAMVHEEKLKLALQRRNRGRFEAELKTYLQDQPGDPNARLWQQRWLYAQGGRLDRKLLFSLLDPLDPETSGLVLRLLRSHSSESLPALLEQMPAAPAQDLQSPAGEEARQQIKSRYDPLAGNPYTGHLALRDASQFGSSIGYEHSFLHDTTGGGTRLPDWQEATFSAYWRQPYAQTLALEYRWDERFDQAASQLLLGWDRRCSMNWSMRLNTGAALSGSFLPAWRVGGGASYRFLDNAFGNLDVNYLSFTDVKVWQWIPGLTWRWHPRLTTDVRVYLSRIELSSGTARVGSTFLTSTTWEFNDRSWWRIHYSIGDEDSANLFRDQVDSQRFQSAGAVLRLGLGRRWAVEPSYRFEIHDHYQLHALGAGLHCRF